MMKMKNYKVVFMGTPEYSVPVLNELIKNCNVIGVVTQPDKEVGRGHEMAISPIKKVALDNNIKVIQPVKIREDFKSVLELNPDIIVTCAYGQIIPKEILDYPKYGCINVHASLLPKYRGGAPIHRAIINGEKETGITIMYMAPGMDDGDIISQEKVEIKNDDTVGILHDTLSKLGAKLLIETLPSIFNGTNERIKQDESKVTFAKIIKKEDEIINFNDTSVNIYNKIRGLNPFPGACSFLDHKRVKIYKSRIIESRKEAETGTIIDFLKDGIVVKTSDGAIAIETLKMEGKREMKAQEFLNGVKKEDLINKRFKEE